MGKGDGVSRMPTVHPVATSLPPHRFRQSDLRDVAEDSVSLLTSLAEETGVRVETDLALLEPPDTAIRRLEAEIEDAAREHYPTELAVLQTTPGVGAVLSLTILLEIDRIDR
ncbi:MAG: hypothetical protein ABR562_05300, partial [Thermoplasmatota archaeon]